MSEEHESRYAILPAAAIDDPDLTETDLRVLGVIGYHSSRKRPAWPRQATIAGRLGKARETVNRSIRRLWRKGYIDIAHQFRDDGGQRESFYFSRLDPDPAVQPVEVVVNGQPLRLVPRVTEKSQPGMTPEITPPVTSGDHTACDEAASHLEEHPRGTSKKNNTPKPPEGGETEGSKPKTTPKPPISAGVKSEFNGLWSLWPAQGRKRSKGQQLCLEALAKAAEKIPASRIVEAAAAFVADRDPRYCPALERWLKNGQYEHYLKTLPLLDGAEKSAERARPAGPAIDWPEMVARWWRSEIWPNRLGERPDEWGYSGPIEPVVALMATVLATGRTHGDRLARLKRNIDDVKRRRLAAGKANA